MPKKIANVPSSTDGLEKKHKEHEPISKNARSMGQRQSDGQTIEQTDKDYYTECPKKSVTPGPDHNSIGPGLTETVTLFWDK